MQPDDTKSNAEQIFSIINCKLSSTMFQDLPPGIQEIYQVTDFVATF